ncbi:glycosyltransferase family 2 protein [Candidatus Fermentibacterales bacterium]|nr:glycosyltransferase family 2 protein [Candidatus Fermentibacterales bacterium]
MVLFYQLGMVPRQSRLADPSGASGKPVRHMMDQPVPGLSVITVSHDSGDRLRSWLESWGCCASELIIVDNGSSDGAAAMAESSGLARVLRMGCNAGYGRAANAGAESASGELIMLTNPDVTPSGQRSVRLLAEAARDSGLLLSGRITGADGKPLPAGGRWPSLPWVVSQLILPARPLGSPEDPSPAWLEGCLLLMKRSDFRALGGFDSLYPLYFEDTDLCYRAVSRGMRVKRVFDAVFVHERGTGAPPRPELRLPCFHWGLYRFFAAHRSASLALAVRWLLVVKCLSRGAALRAAGRTGPARGYLAAVRPLIRGVPPSLEPGPGSEPA